MATRYYFRASVTPDVLPPFDAGWETASASRRLLILKKDNDFASSVSVTPSIPITTTQDILGVQWVGEPLRKQTIAGTFSFIMRCTESVATVEATLAVVVKVVSQDGSIARGTLYSVFGTDTEFGTTAATRIINAAALTPLAIQDGDRLVIEVGTHVTAPSTSGTFSLTYTTSASTDYALTSGLTTAINSWCEFSQDLISPMPNNYRHVRTWGDQLSVTERVR